MLKKTDLSKQFELVVQQEIKNYQDSLNFVLQSIRELKDTIEEVRNESLENHGLLHSLQGDLAIDLQNLRESFNTFKQNAESTFTDQRLFNERNTLEMRDLGSAFYKKICADTHFNEKIIGLWEALGSLRQDSELKDRIINDNLDDLLRRFRQEILKSKKEIIESPSEASLVKKQLEEKIASHTVDVAGIMRELKIYKHDNMVTQKKIENIYTLIDRLNKSEVKP